MALLRTFIRGDHTDIDAESQDRRSACSIPIRSGAIAVNQPTVPNEEAVWLIDANQLRRLSSKFWFLFWMHRNKLIFTRFRAAHHGGMSFVSARPANKATSL